MFKKWKEEWWEKRQNDLCSQYSSIESSLKAELEELLEKDRTAFKNSLNEIEKATIELEYKKKEIEELSKRLDERKLELLQANDELKQQLRIIEAKSSPSSVFTEAFSLGVSKTWDLLLPVMVGNIEALKKKIYEDATFEAISRLNGKKK